MRATGASESTEPAATTLIEGDLDLGGDVEALGPRHALGLAGLTVVRADVMYSATASYGGFEARNSEVGLCAQPSEYSG
jgi:hypothetical protein